MSFSSILKVVGKDAEVVGKDVLAGAVVAGPALNAIVPGASAAIDAVQAMVLAATNKAATPTSGTQQPGSEIKNIIDSAITIGMPFLQTILKAHGYTLVLNTSALDSLVDASIAEFQAVEQFHAGFSFSKTPATASA